MQGRSQWGLIITTSTFSAAARREATRDGASPIDLMDGSQLADTIKELQLGVSTRTVERVEVEADWFKSL